MNTEEGNDDQQLYDIIGVDKDIHDILAATSGPKMLMIRLKKKNNGNKMKSIYISSSQWEFLYWIWKLQEDKSITLSDIVTEYLEQ